MQRSPIKWTGSKYQHSDRICDLLPKATTYYEPFLGGGSTLLRALDYQLYDNYIVSDCSPTLISLWLMVKSDPLEILKSYTSHWLKLRRDINYFYQVRDEYNQDKSDFLKFFFLVRTCTNGMVRFNQKNEFNGSLHKGKIGILPESLEKMLSHANYLLTRNDVEIVRAEYDTIEYQKDSAIYLDPPHMNPGVQMFESVFDYDKFIKFLIKLNSEKYKYASDLDFFIAAYLSGIKFKKYEFHVL